MADLILLALAILCLTWSLVWCISTHSTELGHKSVATFVFQSGLASRYFVPKFPVPTCLKFSTKVHPYPVYFYSLVGINDDERRRYNLHRREQSKRHLRSGGTLLLIRTYSSM